jgi:allophanate hydrolase
VPALESVTLRRGWRARPVVTGSGISFYLAAEGGIDVPATMGSRATYVRAGLGGVDGRALRAGDAVPLAREAASEREEVRLPGATFDAPDVVRVVLGPQDDHFTPAAVREFLHATYTVTPASDRMGLRLSGPRLEHSKGFNIVSDGIPPGAIQVPGDGQPIVLLADRQTTGGYPKIATVISADLPGLGRVGPGASLRFSAVTVAEAELARRLLEADIASWPSRLEPVHPGPSLDPDRLAEVNLVSGVVDPDAGDT